MNLASNTAPLPATLPSRVAPIHCRTGCRSRCWTAFNGLPGVAFVPVSIEVLGHEPELDDEVGGEVLRLGRVFPARGPRRATLDVIRRAFEAAGVEFIAENGGGPGVRLSKRHQKE
jgi:hypothetical protein